MQDLIKEIELLKTENNDKQHRGNLSAQQAESKLREAEALLAVIELSARELNEPMTVIMGLSQLILPHVDSNSLIGTDLAVIIKQVERMNEIVKGINYLANYDIRR